MKLQFKKNEMEISLIMRALSHPARVKIMMMLAKDLSMRFSVGDIHRRLGLSQPETSRHLSVLRHSDVVFCEKSGTIAHYILNYQNPLVKCISRCFNEKA